MSGEIKASSLKDINVYTSRSRRGEDSFRLCTEHSKNLYDPLQTLVTTQLFQEKIKALIPADGNQEVEVRIRIDRNRVTLLSLNGEEVQGQQFCTIDGRDVIAAANCAYRQCRGATHSSSCTHQCNPPSLRGKARVQRERRGSSDSEGSRSGSNEGARSALRSRSSSPAPRSESPTPTAVDATFDVQQEQPGSADRGGVENATATFSMQDPTKEQMRRALQAAEDARAMLLSAHAPTAEQLDHASQATEDAPAYQIAEEQYAKLTEIATALASAEGDPMATLTTQRTALDIHLPQEVRNALYFHTYQYLRAGLSHEEAADPQIGEKMFRGELGQTSNAARSQIIRLFQLSTLATDFASTPSDQTSAALTERFRQLPHNIQENAFVQLKDMLPDPTREGSVEAARQAFNSSQGCSNQQKSTALNRALLACVIEQHSTTKSAQIAELEQRHADIGAGFQADAEAHQRQLTQEAGQLRAEYAATTAKMREEMGVEKRKATDALAAQLAAEAKAQAAFEKFQEAEEKHRAAILHKATERSEREELEAQLTAQLSQLQSEHTALIAQHAKKATSSTASAAAAASAHMVQAATARLREENKQLKAELKSAREKIEKQSRENEETLRRTGRQVVEAIELATTNSHYAELKARASLGDAQRLVN